MVFESYVRGIVSGGARGKGVPWNPKIFADQLTLSQPGGTDYAHLITTGTPGFSDLPTALYMAICGFAIRYRLLYEFRLDEKGIPIHVVTKTRIN